MRRGRPDVDFKRLASLHTFLSQKYALSQSRTCPNKRLLYVHPAMRPGFLRMGYDESELFFTSEGFELAAAENTPAQSKQFDIIWIGRVHRQKGIEDLLATLAYLAAKASKRMCLRIQPGKNVNDSAWVAAIDRARVSRSPTARVSRLIRFRLRNRSAASGWK